MLVEHLGQSPRIHPDAVVAPGAVVSGDVTIGADCQVLHGAVISAEGGPIVLGEHVIVMENAVLRASSSDPLRVGDHCLVGPLASISGARLGDEVFIATGARIFNGAVIGDRSEVRINAVVHLRTELPPESVVPIGWVAVGSPVEMFSPDKHEEIWARQVQLDFPGYVFGFGLWIAKRASGEDTLVARLLTWYPKAAVGAGVMEALVADEVGRADRRMLKLVRMTVSSVVDCPFCVGFNGRDWQKHLTEEELEVVQGRRDAEDVSTFDDAERLAIEYARVLSATPIAVPREMGERLTEHFTEREIVVLATTVAQVGYWARVAQGLGCPAPG